jgi:hypothetical protein
MWAFINGSYSRKFIIGLGTDKFLRVFMILVIVGIIVVIIWRLVDAPVESSNTNRL